MSPQAETVTGQIGAGLLAKADRLFRNNDDSVSANSRGWTVELFTANGSV
jgi:hypothetical protein